MRSRRSRRSAWVSSHALQRLLSPREDDPDIGAVVPGTPLIVAEDGIDGEAGPLELPRHLGHRQRTERQVEPVLPRAVAAALHIFLLERRQTPHPVLADRLDERELCAAGP